MTRFDAADAAGRRDLVEDAVRAHRERPGPYATLSVAEGDPWVQFADGVLNLDCTDEELERLKGLLKEFSAFRVEELSSPEEVDGTNVRVAADAGPGRVAQFVDRVFREVYDRPKDYRLWATEV